MGWNMTWTCSGRFLRYSVFCSYRDTHRYTLQHCTAIDIYSTCWSGHTVSIQTSQWHFFFSYYFYFYFLKHATQINRAKINIISGHIVSEIPFAFMQYFNKEAINIKALTLKLLNLILLKYEHVHRSEGESAGLQRPLSVSLPQFTGDTITRPWTMWVNLSSPCFVHKCSATCGCLTCGTCGMSTKDVFHISAGMCFLWIYGVPRGSVLDCLSSPSLSIQHVISCRVRSSS